MNVVFCHTDYRIYWPARLAAARDFLAKRNVQTTVVEVAGKGSPYAFAGRGGESLEEWWSVLFPSQAMEGISPFEASRAVFHALDKVMPDVVVAGAIAYPSGAAAVRWARSRRRAVVISDDARLTDVPRSRLVTWVKRRIYANVEAVLLPARQHASDYKFWGVPESNMFFGINVVDNELFAARAQAVREQAGKWRERLHLPPHFLLGVGRQIVKKNWPQILLAWQRMKVARPNSALHLVLVGDGPQRPVLEQLTRKRRDVLFLDFAAQDTLAAFYSLADALILPSLYGETWGLVVNEAMACGLPVLVSRQCGCAQTLVKHGENGWVFDADDCNSIRDILLSLDQLSDGDRTSMGDRSREIISHWGLPQFCLGAWKAIQRAVEAPKGPAGLLDRAILALWKGRYRPT